MSANCKSVTSGFCGSLCRNSAGGVTRFYIANTSDIVKSSIATWGVNEDGDEGAIKEMTIDGSLYAYIPFVDSASWSESVQVSPENGTIYYEQTANMVLGANQQVLRNIVNELGKSANIVVIVRDNNDRLWLIGDPTGKRVTWLSSGDSNSGTAYGDRNGWSFSLMCRAAEPAVEIQPADGADIAASIAAADANCDGNAS